MCFSICLCVMLLLVWQTVTTKPTQKSRWILSLMFLKKCELNRFSLWFYFWKFILSFITREPLDNTVCRVWKNFLVILRKTFTSLFLCSIRMGAHGAAPQLSSWGEQKQDRLSWNSDQSISGEIMQHLGPRFGGSAGIKTWCPGWCPESTAWGGRATNFREG